MLCWNPNDLFAWWLPYSLQRRLSAVNGTLKSKNCCGPVLSTFLLCPLCWLHIWGMYRNLQRAVWTLVTSNSTLHGIAAHSKESVSLTPQFFNCSPFVSCCWLLFFFPFCFVFAFCFVGFFGNLASSSIFSWRGFPVHTHGSYLLAPPLKDSPPFGTVSRRWLCRPGRNRPSSKRDSPPSPSESSFY